MRRSRRELAQVLDAADTPGVIAMDEAAWPDQCAFGWEKRCFATSMQ
jgi:hypothetical protein